jgi:hypothetical protein
VNETDDPVNAELICHFFSEASRHEASEQPCKDLFAIEKIRESRTDAIYVGSLKSRVRVEIGEQMARTADMSPDEARLAAHSLLEAAERATAYRARLSRRLGYS